MRQQTHTDKEAKKQKRQRKCILSHVPHIQTHDTHTPIHQNKARDKERAGNMVAMACVRRRRQAENLLVLLLLLPLACVTSLTTNTHTHTQTQHSDTVRNKHEERGEESGS